MVFLWYPPGINPLISPLPLRPPARGRKGVARRRLAKPHSVPSKMDFTDETGWNNMVNMWLVGGIPTPLKNRKVNWDDYSQYMGK